MTDPIPWQFRKFFGFRQRILRGVFYCNQRTRETKATLLNSYKCLRITIGLTGVPNTFEAPVEHVFVGLTKITFLFFDYSRNFAFNPDEHNTRPSDVLLRFREYNIILNPTKTNVSEQIFIYGDMFFLKIKVIGNEDISHSHQPNWSWIFLRNLFLLPSVSWKVSPRLESI